VSDGGAEDPLDLERRLRHAIAARQTGETHTALLRRLIGEEQSLITLLQSTQTTLAEGYASIAGAPPPAIDANGLVEENHRLSCVLMEDGTHFLDFPQFFLLTFFFLFFFFF
jgi:hypothetical protein